VKITRKQPGGVTVLAGERWASIDGDADRVVYFYTNVNGECRLLDGDAIAVLLLNFVRPLIDEMNASANGDDDCLNIGVVQSAYANGASTAYMRDVLVSMRIGACNY
jgi:phosphoacetylglucosamine mutase